MIPNCTSETQFTTEKINPLTVALEWDSKLLEETVEFGKLLRTHAPAFLFTFGAFAFEFARRSLEREPGRRFSYWTTLNLGAEFRQKVEEFDPGAVNVFPLLARKHCQRPFPEKPRKLHTGK